MMRKIFAAVHLWLSIPFGIIIAIVCLTGAVLVFETEIQELCYPSRYFVKEVKGESLSPDVLIRSARRQLPDSIRITGIRIFADPGRTSQLVLPGKKAICFIDPYTATVTGLDDGQGFFMQTMRLHRWLLDSYKRDGSFSWGKALVGYSTLVLAVILISGVVVWWPRNRKVLKSRLRVKTNAGWRRFFYDLHVAGGFYTVLLLLALTLTGLTWSFGWYRSAFYALCGVEAVQSHVPEASGKGGSGQRRKGPDYTRWNEVLTVLRERYTHFNSITVQDGEATVYTVNYGNTRGADRYTFDPQTGTITDIRLYADLPGSGKIRGWIYSVHAGTWGGMTTKVLSCLASLLGAVFALTGYYFWLRKKIRRKK